jgi:hypothetical protein
VTNLAQTVIWLNGEEIAVGRWDGTITIFRCKDTLSIMQALVTPSRQGITMLGKVNEKLFVSSDGPYSMALWANDTQGYFLKDIYTFEPRFGSIIFSVLPRKDFCGMATLKMNLSVF